MSFPTLYQKALHSGICLKILVPEVMSDTRDAESGSREEGSASPAVTTCLRKEGVKEFPGAKYLCLGPESRVMRRTCEGKVVWD